MSQLVNAVQVFDTMERKLLKSNTSKLFQDMVKPESKIFETKDIHHVAKVYQVKVTVGNQVMVSEHELLHNEDALTDAVNNTKRSIVEAIFGEFRPIIQQIHNALYDYDVETARKLLCKLENNMFEVDIKQ